VNHIDPFFTSENTKHYVERPEVAAFFKEKFALDPIEQSKLAFDIERRMSLHEYVNGLEIMWLKRKKFLAAVKTRAIHRGAVNRQARFHLAYRGYNTNPK